MAEANRRLASKVSIVGAGSVGTSLAYACMIRGSADEVALYDINEIKVDAEVQDLSHGTQFTSSSVSGGSHVDVVADSDVIVITAGAKQKPGQTRLDLAATNAGILESLMPQLVSRAPNALYVLVTNPCDVLTVVAQRCSGLDTRRVFSTGTLLDTSRLRWLIASLSNVAQRNVHATIVGEHGDTEFPVWSTARIGTVPIREWLVGGEPIFSDAVLDDLAVQVAQAAYSVIEGKGATNYAIGLAGARLVEALMSNQRSLLPVSSILDDYYGISNVALSVPTLVSSAGVERPVRARMDDSEVEKLQRSAAALKQSLTDLGY